MSNDLLPLLQAYYARTFTGRKAACITEMNSINSGWESDVYAFTVEWGPHGRREREDLILRIYPGADADEKSEKEFTALARLNEAHYPVPRVDRLERRAFSPFGKPFLIMERVPGRGMWQPLFHSTPQAYARLLPLFCGLFVRLHRLDWRAMIPDAAKYEPHGPYDVVEQEFARWQPFIQALPLPGFHTAWKWLEAHRRDVTSDGPVIAHWDFHPENILLKEDGQAVVIDWTGIELTDYRFDLSWTLLLIGANDNWALREPVLREYERQAGKPVEGLEFFDAITSYRRLISVIASIAVGADKLGMRPGAEAMMRRQAPSLRRVYEHFLSITQMTIPEVENFLTEAGV